jgi:hypothetical protein
VPLDADTNPRRRHNAHHGIRLHIQQPLLALFLFLQFCPASEHQRDRSKGYSLRLQPFDPSPLLAAYRRYPAKRGSWLKYPAPPVSVLTA